MDPRLSKCFVRLNRLSIDDNGHCTAAPTSRTLTPPKPPPLALTCLKPSQAKPLTWSKR
ncbi:hypothetical protein DPMN_104907 [Dreissena polymorpha]|uniref:Uncharacterized protein n=1 Tax=Dreissena polymorpha TaxID=45954 RepID=A0A9D4K2X4_DREPO|nr:hypothetical protein DPMN_104907 [Dreissena polymorpha]